MLHALLLLSLPSSSFGTDITLSSASDFKNFVNEVNSGSKYSGTTVYLDSDITLSGSIDPIGANSGCRFLGVFNGQGHVISNLKMNSSSTYAGLFGYSTGLTIKNVILDDYCSITSSYSISYAYVGGIIGYCSTSQRQCNIENSVNMADVTFNGSTSNNLYIGGTVGALSSSNNSAYVKNCVNYGAVTILGTVGSWVELGGIVGISSGSSIQFSYVQNCLNYGTITHKGISGILAVGGVVGYCYNTYIENCVSAGKISTLTTASSTNYVGSIVGYIYNNISINYCYYTSDVNASNLYEYAVYAPSTTETPDYPTTVNYDLVNKLNNNTASYNWDNWFMLYLNGGSINNLTQEILVEIQRSIPNPVKEGNSFLFWCKDTECTEEFDPEADNTSEITGVYAAWVNNTVAFDFDNGTTVNVTFSYNTEIVYPENKKEGYSLSWDNYHRLMPAKDITVTAQWTPNNYTVTFNVSCRDPLPDDETTKIVTFNEKYGELPEPSRAGYTFAGWITESNTSITKETIVTIPRNHTLYARWKKIPGAGKGKYPKFISVVVVAALVIAIAVIVVIVVLLIALRKTEHTNKRYKRIDTKDRYMEINDIEDDESDNQPREEYCRIITTIMEETESKIALESSRGILTNLYPQGYERPSMRDALIEAGLTEKQTVYICCACENVSQKAFKDGKLSEKFTEDDAAAIAMYTYDFGPSNFERSPYRIINKSLVGRNYNSLQRASGMLYLLMTALRKLPRYDGKMLYRGVRGGVNLNKGHYRKGNIITWSALSSTSPSIEATKAFLARGSKSGNAVGTLFVIENGWGYNIQPYSLFPDEVEILLEPERQFEVTGVIKAELTIINLKMLDTPLSIPEVFDEESKFK